MKGTVRHKKEPDWKAAIEKIRQILWLDMARDGDRWNPDKEWDSETIENVAEMLEDLGLKPVNPSKFEEAYRDLPGLN
jgi:hypothetical protein